MLSRTVFRFSQEQVFLTNNRAFDKEMSLELTRLGYSSQYWISQSYCHALNTLPKVSEYERGHKISNLREWIYNADQFDKISERKKIDFLCSPSTPRMAISGKLICGKYAHFFCEKMEFRYNHWIRKEVVDLLGVNVKSGAKGVSIENKSGGNDETIAFFNIDEIERSDLLLKFIKPTYVSAMLGEGINIEASLPLIRAAMLNQYESQVWIAKEYLDHLGVSAKGGEMPTTTTCNASSPLAYTEYPKIHYFNVKQTDDPVKVIEYVNQIQTVPLCAFTGKRYPQEIEEQLRELQRRSPTFSRYWMDVRQACSLGASITAETGLSVRLYGKDIILYNSSQTDHPMACFVAARNYRNLYKISNRSEILARPFNQW